jgi:hypothetical protein
MSTMNSPLWKSREMPSSARVPVGYVFVRSLIETSAATAATLNEHARRIAPAGVFESTGER